MEKPKTLRERAEMKALERYPHEGSGHLRAAFIEAYESGSLQGAKLAWEAAREFGPAMQQDGYWRQESKYQSFDDWLATIMEGN